MKSYKILRFIIIVVLIVLAILLGKTFLKNDKTIEDISLSKDEFQFIDMSLVTEVPLTTNSLYATVEGSYPQFKNADASFNDKIRNNIVIAQAEFENNAKENWQSRINTKLPGEKISQYPGKGDLYFSVKTEYAQVNEESISILVVISGYSGGAHGYESLYSYNYNVNKKREVTLRDYLDGDDYLQFLSTASRNNLLSQFQNNLRRADFEDDETYNEALQNLKSMIQVGTEPIEENFSVFTHTKERLDTPGTLNIYFAEYQVAPYAYGRQLVKIDL